jgi:nucleoside-diphosphate-sugar epimerase
LAEPRVLVTGGTGLVGGGVVRALLERGRAVRVLARDSHRARVLFGSNVEIASGNLRDLESLRRACEGIGQIYHIAGALDTHIHSDGEILDTNVEGTYRLLEAGRAAGISGLVYTSSVSVYGDRLPLGVTENAPLKPAGIYGVSKVRAERLVLAAVAAGLRAMIVRPCIVYGPGDRYFLPQAVRVVRLPVLPLPDGGRRVVDVVHADDLAVAHLLVMEAGQPGQAYNVTGGGCQHVADLIRWIAEALNHSPWRPPISWWLAVCLRPLVNIVGRLWRQPELVRLGRQELNGAFSDYHFDISRITALGYAPRIELSAGLQTELRRGVQTSFRAALPIDRQAPSERGDPSD